MHYSFRKVPWEGVRKEIPFIEIEPEKGDDLPPLEKAVSIESDGLTDDVQYITLRIVWFDKEEKVKIKASFQLKNESFKKSMKTCGIFAEKILEYISECPKEVKDRKALEVGEVLEDADVVGDLKVMVGQIRTWRGIFNAGGTKLDNVISRRHGTMITKDGYYMLFVDYSAFTVFWKDTKSRNEYADGLDIVRFDYHLFDFDPEKEPPEINNEYICWKRPEKKILVVLCHDSTRDAIIDHYGYRDAYNEFLKKKEEEKKEQKRREASYDRIRDEEKVEDKTKRGEIKKELRGILLT